jgi:hypothetical protein
MRIFREIRRRHRRPAPPFFILPIAIPFDEIMDDLTFPASAV